MTEKEEYPTPKDLDYMRKFIGIMELKSEMDRLNYYYYIENRFKLPFCLIGSEARKKLNLNYSVHAIFVDLIEMIKNGELVYVPKEENNSNKTKV